MSDDYIDADGFRANVGIIIGDGAGNVLFARRVGQRGWQFPQGGIRAGEAPLDAMFRELHEELGLERDDVRVLASTRDWHRYTLPDKYIRRHVTPMCIGQKQRWYLLKLIAPTSKIRFDLDGDPEFDHWEWVPNEVPARQVIFFKRNVYEAVMGEFHDLIVEVPSRPAPADRD